LFDRLTGTCAFERVALGRGRVLLTSDLDDRGRCLRPPETEVDLATIESTTEIRPFSVVEGNHFAAWQEPDIFTSELRAAFRPLREGRSS
jgi:hypothetical protein